MLACVWLLLTFPGTMRMQLSGLTAFPEVSAPGSSFRSCSVLGRAGRAQHMCRRVNKVSHGELMQRPEAVAGSYPMARRMMLEERQPVPWAQGECRWAGCAPRSCSLSHGPRGMAFPGVEHVFLSDSCTLGLHQGLRKCPPHTHTRTPGSSVRISMGVHDLKCF